MWRRINEKAFRDLGSGLMGVIIYFIILFVLIHFYNKRKAKNYISTFFSQEFPEKLADKEDFDDQIEGSKLDTKVLGWIIIIYLVIGLYNLLVV